MNKTYEISKERKQRVRRVIRQNQQLKGKQTWDRAGDQAKNTQMEVLLQMRV